MTYFTKTDISKRVEYWGDQAAHIERRLHIGGYRLAEFASDMDRVVKGLRELQGDIEREIYGQDQQYQTETGGHGGILGEDSEGSAHDLSVLDGN